MSAIGPLLAPLTTLPGLGPALAAKLAKLVGGQRVIDLLGHCPSALVTRHVTSQLTEELQGQNVLVPFKVAELVAPPPRTRRPFQIWGDVAGTPLALLFFRFYPNYLEKKFRIGQTYQIGGRLEHNGEHWHITHPDLVRQAAQPLQSLQSETVYPLAAGLTHATLHKALAAALGRLPTLPEWQDAALLRARGWPSWAQALRKLHQPERPADLGLEQPQRQRLAYDELLADQLMLQLIRQQASRQHGHATMGDLALVQKLIANLPFELTQGQQQAWQDILHDLQSPRRMMRLLQGDVGSGKTIIALLAMLYVATTGKQAVLLAPTELLAKQHHANLERLLAPLNLPIGLLLGQGRTGARRATLQALSQGELALVVGTHALLQSKVDYHDLGLVVIDEQHRFGVAQRKALTDKGEAVDLLVMTATPIPRTLAMTSYGDLEVSRLTEKPKGRQEIVTRAISLEKMPSLLERLRLQLSQGAQAYWVCPLINETAESDLAAATARAAQLAQFFGEIPVGLLHGRMPAEERDRVMADFAAGKIPLLVATTVIEVGIDVPNASIMVIEQAERFGLAQLHQLRGRVGRGARASSCVLLHPEGLGAIAKTRLTLMTQTNDGFVIAEEDLRLRGPGEVLGTRQSGAPLYRFAELGAHADLLEIAHREAQLILHRDATLVGERGQALRMLLDLYISPERRALWEH